MQVYLLILNFWTTDLLKNNNDYFKQIKKINNEINKSGGSKVSHTNSHSQTKLKQQLMNSKLMK